mmetsp:Transcript_26760/g.67443  ORF Transcript_26760/g.67443 Transcript_26760/m.67443 type:complete len:264 (+) Transcript_26760:1816-2607(+)
MRRMSACTSAQIVLFSSTTALPWNFFHSSSSVSTVFPPLGRSHSWKVKGNKIRAKFSNFKHLRPFSPTCTALRWNRLRRLEASSRVSSKYPIQSSSYTRFPPSLLHNENSRSSSMRFSSVTACFKIPSSSLSYIFSIFPRMSALFRAAPLIRCFIADFFSSAEICSSVLLPASPFLRFSSTNSMCAISSPTSSGSRMGRRKQTISWKFFTLPERFTLSRGLVVVYRSRKKGLIDPAFSSTIMKRPSSAGVPSFPTSVLRTTRL